MESRKSSGHRSTSKRSRSKSTASSTSCWKKASTTFEFLGKVNRAHKKRSRSVNLPTAPKQNKFVLPLKSPKKPESTVDTITRVGKSSKINSADFKTYVPEKKNVRFFSARPDVTLSTHQDPRKIVSAPHPRMSRRAPAPILRRQSQPNLIRQAAKSQKPNPIKITQRPRADPPEAVVSSKRLRWSPEVTIHEVPARENKKAQPNPQWWTFAFVIGVVIPAILMLCFLIYIGCRGKKQPSKIQDSDSTTSKSRQTEIEVHEHRKRELDQLKDELNTELKTTKAETAEIRRKNKAAEKKVKESLDKMTHQDKRRFVYWLVKNKLCEKETLDNLAMS